MLYENGLDKVVCRDLGLENTKIDIKPWQDLVAKIKARSGEVTIGLVGKYVELHDSYLSVVEALNHASYECGRHLNIKWILSDELTDENAKEQFEGCDGIIVPGGFGGRGIEGMIVAARYARVNHIPYFGICLGMQIAVIEYARDVLGYKDANSREFDEESKHLVIDLMPDQRGLIKGGTMRLGAYPCVIQDGTMMAKAYGQKEIRERHRHRYEFNNDFKDELIKGGLTVSGMSPNGEIVETVEIKGEKFFVGVQFHPEFKSRPNKAHPLFREFVKASCK